MQRLIHIICLCMALTICTACIVDGGNNGGSPTSVCDQSSGIAYVGMGAQSTSQGKTGIYNTGEGGFADPLAWCQNKGAIITRITNTSGHSFSLAHGGPGSPFIILNANNSTDFWNNQRVEGHYTAQYSGQLTEAPNGLTVKVEWRRP